MAASSIIEYIARYDGDVRRRLLTVYELIRTAVPDEAAESISWRMPTFKLGTEPLFFFTGTKRHELLPELSPRARERATSALAQVASNA